MSKKRKGVASDLTTPYGVGLYEDDRARLKHQSLMQDYQELQKEVDVMRSRLEAVKQRKMMLAAEVRFLQKRFGYLAKTKTMNSSPKEKLVQASNLYKTKHTKEFSQKEVGLHKLPPIREARPKKRQYVSKEVVLCGKSPVSQHQRKMYSLVSDLSLTRKNNLTWNTTPVLDLSKKERMQANDTVPRITSVTFDLNQDDSSSGKESSLPIRAPIFDLNEILVMTNAEVVKCEKARRSLMRPPS